MIILRAYEQFLMCVCKDEIIRMIRQINKKVTNINIYMRSLMDNGEIYN